VLKSILPKTGSSSSQIDIEDISDAILKLPGNRYRLVMSTTSINFELKSEEEQDALINTYESFLNSISFNIQFLIRTREIDMDSYLNSLSGKIAREALPIYKSQLEGYRQFISNLITANKILSRHFYIIIPYEPPKDHDKGLAHDQLELRADIITKNLNRLGIGCRKLSSIELIDLFYSFYSPELAKSQPISEKVLEVMDSEFISKQVKK
jgi:hypothetical protein